MKVRMLVKYLIAILLTTLLASCSSVPISSMLKMASLDVSDIIAIQPNVLRVRLSVSEPVELKTNNVKLVLSFEHRDKSASKFDYVLENISQSKTQSIASFFGNEPEKSVYLFKLSKQSELEFNRYQQSFKKKGKPKAYHWTVYYYFKTRPKKGTQAEIDIELKLAKDEDFFYLLKSAKIK